MVNQRRQMVLIYQNNIFHINRRYNHTTFWKCHDYKKMNCKCRIITTNGSIKKSAVDHNHPPHTDKIKQRTLNLEYVTAYNC